MKPIRNTPGTLIDLLDRVLDKGLIIQADLVITLAGVPLIGVCLRAAVASLETMLKYGMFQDWDLQIRDEERRLRDSHPERIMGSIPNPSLAQGVCETSLLEPRACPQCGRDTYLDELLGQGCPRCGWIKPMRP